MANEDALNKAKRALVPRGKPDPHDALSRAKRALVPAAKTGELTDLLQRARAAGSSSTLPAVANKETGRVKDLLAQARELARPVERPAVVPEAPRAVLREEPAKQAPVPEPLHNPPPALITKAAPAPQQPRAVHQPVEVLPAQTQPPVANAPVNQTIVVQVAAPAPPYPYPYLYPPYWAGCGSWSCPYRVGLICNRSWWTCGRF